MNFDVNDNTMAYLSGNENEVYTVHQKQRSRNFLEWVRGRSELDCIFNVMQSQFSVFNFSSYIISHFLDFTLILNVLFRNEKPQFHCLYKRLKH